MRFLTTRLAFTLFALCALGVSRGEAFSGRALAWREDLEFFARRFPARQVDFGRLYDEAAFEAEIAALQNGAAHLTDADIALRLMKLVAMANVGHNRVGIPIAAPFRRLSLTLNWYADGLAVIGAAPEYSAALGARVLRIGRLTPQQLLKAIAPWISHETDWGLLADSPAYFTVAELLTQCGAANSESRVEFTLIRKEGEPFTIVVAPGDPKATRQVIMFDALHLPVSLSRKHPSSYYWSEYLADFRAMYIQYNRCGEDPRLPFDVFARGVFAFAEAHPVERVVIDLRFNGGGIGSIIDPLARGLKERKALGSHVYVLIGNYTFSSAEDNAIDLRRELNAKLVGEPAGGKPNQYADIRSFTLPKSRLEIQYSTRFVRMTGDADPQVLEPDIPAPATLKDILNGRDPALEAALHAPPQ